MSTPEFKLLKAEIKHLKELLLRSEAANENSLRIAKENIDGRLEKLNELREDFARQQGVFATKADITALSKELTAIQTELSGNKGTHMVEGKVVAYVAGIIAIVIASALLIYFKQ